MKFKMSNKKKILFLNNKKLIKHIYYPKNITMINMVHQALEQKQKLTQFKKKRNQVKCG